MHTLESIILNYYNSTKCYWTTCYDFDGLGQLYSIRNHLVLATFENADRLSEIKIEFTGYKLHFHRNKKNIYDTLSNTEIDVILNFLKFISFNNEEYTYFILSGDIWNE